MPAKTLGGLSQRYRRMCDVYLIFVEDWKHLVDLSDEAKVELFNHESLGFPISPNNGYALGKKWLNVQVTMWFEDIEKGLFWSSELYEDPKYPHWWLDSIFKSHNVSENDTL
jgi:hypothetical protein